MNQISLRSDAYTHTHSWIHRYIVFATTLSWHHNRLATISTASCSYKNFSRLDNAIPILRTFKRSLFLYDTRGCTIQHLAWCKRNNNNDSNNHMLLVLDTIILRFYQISFLKYLILYWRRASLVSWRVSWFYLTSPCCQS